jgi:hypothetical protein
MTKIIVGRLKNRVFGLQRLRDFILIQIYVELTAVF